MTSCPYCDAPLKVLPDGTAEECGCYRSRDARIKRLLLEAYSNPDRTEYLRRCGVPPLYLRVEPDYETADRIHPGNDEVDAVGLYITGDVGRGKTTLACAIMKAKANQAKRPLPKMHFTSMPDLFTRIRDTYSDNGKSEKDIIDELGSVDLLVLDDLGKGSCNDWALGIVYQIIDRRVGNMLPTVVTTQYQLPDLGRMLSRNAEVETASAIISRIVGSCESKLIEGPDRRWAR